MKKLQLSKIPDWGYIPGNPTPLPGITAEVGVSDHPEKGVYKIAVLSGEINTVFVGLTNDALERWAITPKSTISEIVLFEYDFLAGQFGITPRYCSNKRYQLTRSPEALASFGDILLKVPPAYQTPRRRVGRHQGKEDKTMRKFYAAQNEYGSSTSRGFANTWSVLVFKSRAERDEYVEQSKNITTRAIKKYEASGYLAGRDCTPRPFSGEYWGVSWPEEWENRPARVELCEGYERLPRFW